MNWADPKAKVSAYFNVKEMIYLPRWKRLANESDGLDDEVKANLLHLAAKMDMIRMHFNTAIRVHVTYRPKEYNELIGGAKRSSHIGGFACDFDIPGIDCDLVREKILDDGLLEKLDLYMEHKDGSNWVHLNTDDGIVRNRYFKP
jgi:uncharacterized protein YcbK (DUF882 family)